MTSKELLNIDIADFNKMSRKELSKAVSTLGATANKRLKSFETKGIKSPATSALSKSGGKISAKGKNINQLRAEYVRAKNFLTAETSTIKGYKQNQRDVIEQLGLEGVDELTEKQFNKLWQAYEILKERSPEISNKRFKYSVLQDIADEIISDGRISARTIADRLDTQLSNIYEESRTDENGVSGFFEYE